MIVKKEYDLEFQKETNYNEWVQFVKYNPIRLKSNPLDILHKDLDYLWNLKKKGSDKYISELKEFQNRMEKRRVAVEKRKLVYKLNKDIIVPYVNKKKRLDERKHIKLRIEEQKQEKYNKIDKQKKVHLANVFKEKDSLFMKNMVCKVSATVTKTQKNNVVKTYDEAVSIIKTINILQWLNIDVELKFFFPCIIIDGNYASVNIDKEGFYKYFTYTWDFNEKYSLDIIDLVEIIYNVKYYEAIRILCSMANINVDERYWVDKQSEKYINNIIYIENEVSDMENKYKTLYKYIKKHLYLLKKMNSIGLENIQTLKESVSGESIFFCACRFLSEELEKLNVFKSKATINKILNMFCALGLIQKVTLHDIPIHLRPNDIFNKIDDGGKFATTFYKIPSMSIDLMVEAERRVDKLNEAGITAININNRNLRNTLGEKILDEVYGDTKEITSIINEISKRNRIIAKNDNNISLNVDEEDWYKEDLIRQDKYKKNIIKIHNKIEKDMPLTADENEIKKQYDSFIIKKQNDKKYSDNKSRKKELNSLTDDDEIDFMPF